MKITQEIIDNGKKIVHINYTKADIAEMKEKTAKPNIKSEDDVDKTSEENSA